MTPRLVRPFFALLLGLALAPPGFAQQKQQGYDPEQASEAAQGPGRCPVGVAGAGEKTDGGRRDAVSDQGAQPAGRAELPDPAEQPAGIAGVNSSWFLPRWFSLRLPHRGTCWRSCALLVFYGRISSTIICAAPSALAGLRTTVPCRFGYGLARTSSGCFLGASLRQLLFEDSGPCKGVRNGQSSLHKRCCYCGSGRLSCWYFFRLRPARGWSTTASAPGQR